jgi:hypothetical protein
MHGEERAWSEGRERSETGRVEESTVRAERESV